MIQASQSLTNKAVKWGFTASQHFTESAVKLVSRWGRTSYLLHSRVCEVPFVKLVSRCAARLHASQQSYPLKGVYFIE